MDLEVAGHEEVDRFEEGEDVLPVWVLRQSWSTSPVATMRAANTSVVPSYTTLRWEGWLRW